ncbi:unnamed protein product [Haemonchus placei]|uniref:Uncharacterized protein n=1 Tax=Haemonchus placei TaxID=6290 RepID=A0A3P7TTY9_HAEPC|nr:unnamed protein product [Haemonchus placei]
MYRKRNFNENKYSPKSFLIAFDHLQDFVRLITTGGCLGIQNSWKIPPKITESETQIQLEVCHRISLSQST